jgi:hypothetical protein
MMEGGGCDGGVARSTMARVGVVSMEMTNNRLREQSKGRLITIVDTSGKCTRGQRCSKKYIWGGTTNSWGIHITIEK